MTVPAPPVVFSLAGGSNGSRKGGVRSEKRKLERSVSNLVERRHAASTKGRWPSPRHFPLDLSRIPSKLDRARALAKPCPLFARLIRIIYSAGSPATLAGAHEQAAKRRDRTVEFV